MANDRNAEVEAWDFLKDADAPIHFGKVDYALKNGRHIQLWKEQISLFRFIDDNIISLQLYYRKYFGVELVYAGETIDKYYYLEFFPGNRGNVPIENRQFLQNEHVIVGFMLYKAVYIDGYIELNSVKSFQKMLRQDYEELKAGLLKTLAKAKGVNVTQMNHDKMDSTVSSALKVFDKIGWIELKEDIFETLPSFQRLPRIYGDYINSIDDWLKNEVKK